MLQHGAHLKSSIVQIVYEIIAHVNSTVTIHGISGVVLS